MNVSNKRAAYAATRVVPRRFISSLRLFEGDEGFLFLNFTELHEKERER